MLVRLQATDAGLVIDDARAAVARAEANAKLADAQRQLAETTAQRYASLEHSGDIVSLSTVSHETAQLAFRGA